MDGAVLYGHLAECKYEFLKLMHNHASTALTASEEARMVRLSSVEPEVVVKFAEFQGESS